MKMMIVVVDNIFVEDIVNVKNFENMLSFEDS
jgi:hypothetical protein